MSYQVTPRIQLPPNETNASEEPYDGGPNELSQHRQVLPSSNRPSAKEISTVMMPGTESAIAQGPNVPQGTIHPTDEHSKTQMDLGKALAGRNDSSQLVYSHVVKEAFTRTGGDLPPAQHSKSNPFLVKDGSPLTKEEEASAPQLLSPAQQLPGDLNRTQSDYTIDQQQNIYD